MVLVVGVLVVLVAELLVLGLNAEEWRYLCVGLAAIFFSFVSDDVFTSVSRSHG